jgi:hypothetical protein
MGLFYLIQTVKHLFFIGEDAMEFPYENFLISFFRGSLGYRLQCNLVLAFSELELVEAKMCSIGNLFSRLYHRIGSSFLESYYD